MKFLRLDVCNFLSFEQESLPLSDIGLVLIRGQNTDSAACGSNGSGKSSLTVDAWCWALYGETARSTKGSEVVRKNSTGGCWAAISFSDGTNVWQVVRYQDHDKMKNGLRLLRWVDGVAIDESIPDKRETQAKIERLLKLPMDVALSAIALGQNSIAFATMTDGEKKGMLERVLQFDKFVTAEKRARAQCNDVQMKLSLVEGSARSTSATVATLGSRVATLETQSADWTRRNTEERVKQETRLLDTIENLSKTATQLEQVKQVLPAHQAAIQEASETYAQAYHEWQTATNKLQVIKGQQEILLKSLNIDDLRAEEQRLGAQLKSSTQRLTVLQQTTDAKLGQCTQKMKVFESKIPSIATSCPACNQGLPTDKVEQAKQHLAEEILKLKQESHDIAMATDLEQDERVNEIKATESQIAATREKILAVQGQASQLDANLIAAESEITKALQYCTTAKQSQTERENGAREWEAHKSQLDIEHARLVQYKTQLELSLGAQQENPFLVALENTKADLKLNNEQLINFNNQTQELNAQYALYSFWVKGYGKSGIQSYLLDSVVPYLNERVADWASVIWQGEVTIEFKTQRMLQTGALKEDFHIAINHSSGAETYSGLSAGEQERTDLCISLALQDLILSRFGNEFNLCIMDEVCHYTDGEGAEAYFRMLHELARRRNTVIVITHNPHLEALFPKIWTVRKQNGISKLEQG